MPDEEVLCFPCFLCGDGLEVRLSVKQKPYLTCNQCGTQIFIRKTFGIQIFKNVLKRINGKVFTDKSKNVMVSSTIAISNQIFFLNLKRDEILDQVGTFQSINSNPGFKSAVDSIEDLIEQLESTLNNS